LYGKVLIHFQLANSHDSLDTQSYRVHYCLFARGSCSVSILGLLNMLTV